MFDFGSHSHSRSHSRSHSYESLSTVDCPEGYCNLLPPESKWVSSVHEETQWFGVWRQYDCDFLEFTDEQLQQCVTRRKISSITTKGLSIAVFLREFLKRRLENIQFYNACTYNELSCCVPHMHTTGSHVLPLFLFDFVCFLFDVLPIVYV